MTDFKRCLGKLKLFNVKYIPRVKLIKPGDSGIDHTDWYVVYTLQMAHYMIQGQNKAS